MSNADFSSSPTPNGDATQLVKSVAPSSSVLAAGTLLGNTYVIEALLARGGMGEVYRARHVELGSEHAIKIMLPSLAEDPKIVQLFREEARKLGRINNEAIVDYEGFFRDQNGLRYLVTEFVEGESLEQVLRRRRLEPDEVLRLRNRLVLGLAAAHEMGIVHRDVSPGNILLPEGNIVRAKLIDFGIAKSTDPAALTVVGSDFAGKYSYVSPEQLGLFGGQVDLRSDIYSLGLVLAAAAIGFGGRLDMGSSAPTMIAARQRVPDLSAVPPVLRPVIAPMLQPRPEDRPPSMRALLEDGDVFAQQHPKPSGRQAPARSPGRKWIWLAAGALGAICALAGLTVALWPVPSIEEMRTDLIAATSGYQCSDLSASVNPDRGVVVSGFAATSEDIERLRRAAQSIRGVTKLSYEVKLRSWPHCELAAILKPLIEQGGRNPPTLSLASPGSEAHIGEPLVLDVRSAAFDSYVYIDYFPAGDQVLHLLPNEKDVDNHKPVANHFALGRWPMKRCWILGGEAGQQLVTLVSSNRRLFAAQRQEIEKVADYLPALAQALAANRQDRRSAAMLFFDLGPRDPARLSSETGCPPG
jgi:serine/threonine protein kinase